ncbi:MAG: hypothetical protein H6492_00135 [Candidatus Paracaedibacteraceae bacterium]|nr:hypothetical protein [Candidatus Paracaedibacteraceae bacterium]
MRRCKVIQFIQVLLMVVGSTVPSIFAAEILMPETSDTVTSVGVLRVSVKQADGSERKYRGIGTLVKLLGVSSDLGGRVVLTARHCVENADAVRFEFGDQEFWAQKVYYHAYASPEAGLCPVAGDVAFVVLKEAVTGDCKIPWYRPFVEISAGSSLINHTLREGKKVVTSLVVEGNESGVYSMHGADSNPIFLTNGDSGSPLLKNDVIVGVYSSSRNEDKEKSLTTDAGEYIGAFAIFGAVWLKMLLGSDEVLPCDIREELSGRSNR